MLFKVGSLPIHSWGLLVMAGFFLAAWRAVKHSGRYGFTAEDLWDVSLWGLVGGLMGARFAYIIQNTGYFAAHPTEVFAVWTGGMTFYGGLFGGILAGVAVCRVKKLNVADMADLAAVSFPIGYTLGRIGCFLNGCCHGSACPAPLGMQFHQPDGTLTGFVHPAQLYSAAAGVLLYFLMLTIEKRRAFRGQVMLWFLIGYSVYRFLIEYVRAGVTADVTSIAHLTTGQIASLVIALFCAVWLYLASRRAAANPPAQGGSGEGPKVRKAAATPASAGR